LRDVYPINNDKRNLETYLLELDKLDLTPRENTNPELAYIFKHAITQDVAYNLLLFAQRQDLHKAIGTWYEKKYTNEISEMLPTLAHHWQHSGDQAKALYYLDAAAQQAISQFANREAIHFLNIIQEHFAQPLKADINHLMRWQKNLGQAHKGLGNMETSQRHFENAMHLMGYHVPKSTAGWILDLIRELAHRTIFHPKKKSADDPNISQIRETILILEGLMEIFFFSLNVPAFAACLIHLLNQVDQIGPSPEMARGYAAATLVAGLVPAHGIAQKYDKITRAVVKELGEFDGAGYALSVISLYNAGVGNFSQALQDTEDAVQSALFFNNRARMAEPFITRAQVLQRLGRYSESYEFFEKTYQVGVENENVQYQVWGRNGKAGIILYQGFPGHIEIAIELLEESLTQSVDVNDLTEKIRGYGLLSVARMRQSKFELAEEAAEKGLKIIEKTSPPAHDTFEGYTGVTETFLNLLEAHPKDRELRKKVKKALNGLKKFCSLFPIGEPRYFCYLGWYEWVSGNRRRAEFFWQKSLHAAKKIGMSYEIGILLYEQARHKKTSLQANLLEDAYEYFKLSNNEYELNLISNLLRIAE
jgi:tetratricopeptide (TPR) repeat protein